MRALPVTLLLALSVVPTTADTPDVLPAPARLESLPAGKHQHMWKTRRFTIATDAPLGRDLLEPFAQVADTVPDALARLPLPLLAPPAGEPPLIRILDDRGYDDAGGGVGTAGFYTSHPPPRLLVRRSYLLHPPTRQPTRLAAAPDQDLLVHELTHLCMHRLFGRVPPWFAEGSAEYLACLHQVDGRFSSRNVERSIRDHLRRRYNPNDPVITLTPVAKIPPLRTGDRWLDFTAKLPRNDRYHPYATALLLFHYHYHGGSARRDALRQRLESASTSRRPDLNWLNPAESRQIEASLTRFWKPNGLHLRFSDALR